MFPDTDLNDFDEERLCPRSCWIETVRLVLPALPI